MLVEQALADALAASMDVSLRARIAQLVESVAVVVAVGPCHMWDVVKAST